MRTKYVLFSKSGIPDIGLLHMTEDEEEARAIAKNIEDAHPSLGCCWSYESCGDGYMVKKKRDRNFKVIGTPRVLKEPHE